MNYIREVYMLWVQHSEWRKMFYRHLVLAKLMATQMINDKYKESIGTYDIFEKEVIIMADMMAEGISRQFLNMLCGDERW